MRKARGAVTAHVGAHRGGAGGGGGGAVALLRLLRIAVGLAAALPRCLRFLLLLLIRQAPRERLLLVTGGRTPALARRLILLTFSYV